MNHKTLLRFASAILVLALPLAALDPILDPMIAAIYASEESTPHGDSLKVALEENLMNLFAYRAAGQSRHPDLLEALGHGLGLLRVQYQERLANACNQAQADSLEASLSALDGYEDLLDSLSANP